MDEIRSTMVRRAAPRQLSTMFALTQMATGAAFVLLSGHMGELGFSGRQISYVFATTAMAALISPLVAGWLADHYWPSQAFLGSTLLATAPVLVVAWLQTSFVGFWIAMGLAALIRLPTVTLTNAIAFYHLSDRQRFGHVRVWGTIGWIAISWLLSVYLRIWEIWVPQAHRLGDGLLVAAMMYAIAGIYSFTLPNTPPGNTSQSPYTFLSAFRLLRRRSFAVLVAIAFVSATMSPFFYNFSFLFLTDPDHLGLSPSVANLAQSLGQVTEVVVLLALASSLSRLGMKRILLLGIAAQAMRFGLLALGRPLWLVVSSLTLHGAVFTFFYVGLVIAIERFSSKEYRVSAQGLLVFARNGIGALCGHFLAGEVYDVCTLPDDSHAWGIIFLVPSCVTVLGLLIFALLFREEPPRGRETHTSDSSALEQPLR